MSDVANAQLAHAAELAAALAIEDPHERLAAVVALKAASDRQFAAAVAAGERADDLAFQPDERIALLGVLGPTWSTDEIACYLHKHEHWLGVERERLAERMRAPFSPRTPRLS